MGGVFNSVDCSIYCGASFLPSLAFACFINIVKPTGTLKVCRSVSICGAVVASLYMFFADFHLRRNSLVNNYKV